jgi:hypothetical protein
MYLERQKYENDRKVEWMKGEEQEATLRRCDGAKQNANESPEPSIYIKYLPRLSRSRALSCSPHAYELHLDAS